MVKFFYVKQHHLEMAAEKDRGDASLKQELVQHLLWMEPFVYAVDQVGAHDDALHAMCLHWLVGRAEGAA